MIPDMDLYKYILYIYTVYVSGCICVHTYTVLLGLSKVWCPTPLYGLWVGRWWRGCGGRLVGSSRSSRSRSGSGRE